MSKIKRLLSSMEAKDRRLQIRQESLRRTHKRQDTHKVCSELRITDVKPRKSSMRPIVENIDYFQDALEMGYNGRIK